MKSTIFALATSLICATSALAMPFGAVHNSTKRDCSFVPPGADPGIVNQIMQTCRNRGANDKVILATFETAWVESRVNNLNCGDQDSIGVFQQRPSMGWGSYDQIMDVNYSTNKFLDQCIPNDAANPGYTPGQLAQSVQRSDFPTRYDTAEGIARQLISQAGGNGGSSGGNGGCGHQYTVAAGDWCTTIASRFGIDIARIFQMNPGVNGNCTNLQPGQVLCLP